MALAVRNLSHVRNVLASAPNTGIQFSDDERGALTEYRERKILIRIASVGLGHAGSDYALHLQILLDLYRQKPSLNSPKNIASRS